MIKQPTSEFRILIILGDSKGAANEPSKATPIRKKAEERMQPIAKKRSCALDRLLLVTCSENMLPQKMIVRGLIIVSTIPCAKIS